MATQITLELLSTRELRLAAAFLYQLSDSRDGIDLTERGEVVHLEGEWEELPLAPSSAPSVERTAPLQTDAPSAAPAQTGDGARRRRRSKAEIAAAAAEHPTAVNKGEALPTEAAAADAAAKGRFVLLDSSGTKKAAYDTSQDAALAIIEVFEAAPSRASLDNLLHTNAAFLKALDDGDRKQVVSTYAEMSTKFEAAITAAPPAPPAAPAAKSDAAAAEAKQLAALFEEAGEDSPPAGAPEMPKDAEALKMAVRKLCESYIQKVGVVEGIKYMKANGGERFSKIPSSNYPAMWKFFTVEQKLSL